jgi:hypothetical protein
MYDGYLGYAGIEITNAARTAAYIDALGIIGTVEGTCDVCPDLSVALGDVTYVDPVADNAPWYDPNVPESGLLAGFMVADQDGLGATTDRDVSLLAAGGGVVGPYRQLPREVTVTFRSVAASPAAAAYSVAWLSKQLRGSECSPLSSEFSRLASNRGCGSDVLCMFTVCPTNPTMLSQVRVNLFDVGVTSGPKIVKKYTTDDGSGGCTLTLIDMEVVFTAGDPGWYYSPVRVADISNLGSFCKGTVAYDITTTFTDLNCGTEVCFDTDPAGCVGTDGPDMVAPPTPCVGVPSFTANHYAVTLDFSTIPSTMDLIPQLYYTGSPKTPATTGYEGPVSFQIRRPTPGVPCGSVPSPCDVPIELFTAQQRRDRTGVLDWRRKKAYRTVSSVPVCPYPVFTRELAPFTWPTLICADEMCLDVYINAANDGRSQRIVLDVMRRVDGLG